MFFQHTSIHHNSNLRNFIEAILYRIRTGCPW
ncbi:IS5/IS1182 family transposase, partial [Acinetobacter baumannii]